MMSYPVNTASILSYVYPDTELFWDVAFISNVTDIIRWDEVSIGSPKPTEQEVTDIGNSAEYNRWVKSNELAAQKTIYTANDIVADRQLSDKGEVEDEWIDGKNIELLKLTDVQAIKDFDTTKPVTLDIANQPMGALYVNQGLEMQSQNDAAVSAGLSARWDQTILDAFIAGNELAAQDVTSAQPVIHPDYQIRQGSVTPSDRSSRLLIYRGKRDYSPGFENLDSLEMILSQREDDRALYAFLYLQSGSYLEWVQFVEQADGTWRAHNSVNTYTHMTNDLDIIFSYGTNPAVQQDYFTDKVPFDAGGEQVLIRIRWDAEDIVVTNGRSAGRRRNP